MAFEEEDDETEMVAVVVHREPKIVVTAEMRRMELDALVALVALWCCRVWARSAEARPEAYEGLSGGEYCSFVDELGIGLT